MTEKETPSEGRAGRDGIGRRTVVRAAAWSAPVIAVAVATPFAAASIGTGAVSFETAGNAAPLPIMDANGADTGVTGAAPNGTIISALDFHNGDGATSNIVVVITLAVTGSTQPAGSTPPGVGFLAPIDGTPPGFTYSDVGYAQTAETPPSTTRTFTIHGSIENRAEVTFPIQLAYTNFDPGALPAGAYSIDLEASVVMTSGGQSISTTQDIVLNFTN